MSTPIYTDKEYLDEQFRITNKAIYDLDLRMTLRMDGHDAWHRRWGRNAIALLGIILGAFGAAWPKS